MTATGPRTEENRPTSRDGTDRDVFAALLAITALALVARLWNLGGRTAHWDEARVAYWTARYVETGFFEYQPIIHGPFLPQVNRVVFAAVGPSDLASRFVVALLGGLLPVVAWLLRDRLRDAELLALAALLAANPLLLYYSRFMRNDVVLAALSLAALALFVRAYDTGRLAYFHAGVLALAVAFTTMGNAILYPLCWIGALGLLLVHRWIRAYRTGGSPVRVTAEYARRTALGLYTSGPHLALGALSFLLVTAWFYAPRAGTEGGVGIDRLGTDPGLLPGVLAAATVESWEAMVDLWVTGDMQDEPAYADALAFFAETMWEGALVVCALALVGIAVEFLYREPRDLVAVCTYWGLVSIPGYPLAMDILSPWTPVHAIVPLCVPAAVGSAWLYRLGRTSLAAGDHTRAAVAGVVLLLCGAQIGAVAATSVYANEQSRENPLVQYAQPAGEIGDRVGAMERAVERSEGDLALVYYGEDLALEDERAASVKPIGDPEAGNWYHRLPMPWYAAVVGIGPEGTESTDDPDDLDDLLAGEPAVVIGPASERETLDERLVGYDSATYETRLWASEGRSYSEVVIYVSESEDSDVDSAAESD
ncbi:flippase activity-associated protein Agl23 [Natronorarus salvus]|uniref:flippase activity-associated protein Agl23 n=1 Tax=Natronorarus salvus TaxID=3117733 RepID=UPI002F26AC1B